MDRRTDPVETILLGLFHRVFIDDDALFFVLVFGKGLSDALDGWYGPEDE